MSDLPDHVRRNRALWDNLAQQYVAAGEENWAAAEPRWGIWDVPESQLGIFPEGLAGKDAIELGCGTAYVSAWLARRGARVVAIDNSEAQLATARRLQQQHGLHFPLLHGSAEAIPYPDQSFDFAISEYGACLWADPERWVPEASRLLRPDGQLVFLTNSFLLTLCMPVDEGVAATDRLLRSIWYAPRRVAERSGRRVSPLARRLGAPASALWLQHRGSPRGTAYRRRDDALPVRDARVGRAVAMRRGMESAQVRMIVRAWPSNKRCTRRRLRRSPAAAHAGERRR